MLTHLVLRHGSGHAWPGRRRVACRPCGTSFTTGSSKKKILSSISASAAAAALAVSGVSVGLAVPAQASQFCQNQTISGANVDDTIIVPSNASCTLNNINPSASGTYAARGVVVGQGGNGRCQRRNRKQHRC